MKPGERISVNVRAIANGFLVKETKGDGDYGSTESEPLFYPTMEAVERELVFRLRAADELALKENF